MTKIEQAKNHMRSLDKRIADSQQTINSFMSQLRNSVENGAQDVVTFGSSYIEKINREMDKIRVLTEQKELLEYFVINEDMQ